jgi:hypothetical protein
MRQARSAAPSYAPTASAAKTPYGGLLKAVQDVGGTDGLVVGIGRPKVRRGFHLIVSRSVTRSGFAVTFGAAGSAPK